jgi:hypothetical protein
VTLRIVKTNCILSSIGLLSLCATFVLNCGCGAAASIPQNRNLLSIAVHPANSFVLPGATVPFAATASFDLPPVTENNFPAHWSSSDTTMATIDANGVATCVQQGGPITITASASEKGGTVTAAATLNCTSQVAEIEFAPDPQHFACAPVVFPLFNCVCTPQKTTSLINNGTSTLRINSISVPGPAYQLIDTTCGQQLAPGDSCDIAVGWSRVAGQGEILVDDDAVASPHTATLSGVVLCRP